jgi:hypothetical protein
MEAWLRDKAARTVEERFGAEVIMEQVERAFYAKKGWQWESTWEEERECKKARRLNPAYQPKIHYGVLRDRVASIAEEVTSLHVSCDGDRYVRDVSFLQFFPNVTDLHLTGGALQSIEPLKHLPKLESLMVSDHELADLKPIGACTKLKSLYLATYVSWPDFPELSKLTELNFLNWRGNLLLLEEVPALPALEKGEFHHGYGAGTPLRDFRRLPEMGRVRSLTIDMVASLEGVGRYPSLLNLDVKGRFRDLRPLTALPQLTHLKVNRGDVVHSDFTFDVTPLVKLPELREVEFVTDQPIDFSPLIEAPKLREISRQGYHVNDRNLNALEVNTINAVLTSWDEDYALPQPRALPPLVFQVVESAYKELTNEARTKQLSMESEFNPRLYVSEITWISRKMEKALTQLVGAKWGEILESMDPMISVQTLEAAERMPEIVQVVRETLAASRRERHAMIVVDLDAEWETEGDEWDPDAEFKREFEDHMAQKKKIAERKAYLERLYQVRLKEQEGEKINPADFGPDNVPPAKEKSDEDPEPDSDVAVYEEKQKEHPMAEALWSRLWVSEKGIYVCPREQAAMEHLMGRKADAP